MPVRGCNPNHVLPIGEVSEELVIHTVVSSKPFSAAVFILLRRNDWTVKEITVHLYNSLTSKKPGNYVSFRVGSKYRRLYCTVKPTKASAPGAAADTSLVLTCCSLLSHVRRGPFPDLPGNPPPIPGLTKGLVSSRRSYVSRLLQSARPPPTRPPAPRLFLRLLLLPCLVRDCLCFPSVLPSSVLPVLSSSRPFICWPAWRRPTLNVTIFYCVIERTNFKTSVDSKQSCGLGSGALHFSCA